MSTIVLGFIEILSLTLIGCQTQNIHPCELKKGQFDFKENSHKFKCKYPTKRKQDIEILKVHLEDIPRSREARKMLPVWIVPVAVPGDTEQKERTGEFQKIQTLTNRSRITMAKERKDCDNSDRHLGVQSQNTWSPT